MAFCFGEMCRKTYKYQIFPFRFKVLLKSCYGPNLLTLTECYNQHMLLLGCNFWLCLSSRAVNNELLDTYQLKSLDGLVEGGLEDIAIVHRRRIKRKTKKKTLERTSMKKKQLYLTLSELLDRRNANQGTNITAENLPGYHDDNFSLRQPYDRVIRCLGFRFNFSIFNMYEHLSKADMLYCYL